MMDSILTLMTFIPLLGAAVILCLPRDAEKLIKWTALVATVEPYVTSRGARPSSNSFNPRRTASAGLVGVDNTL